MKQVFYSLLVLCLLSCSDDILQPSQSEIVVEGWIEDGEFPVVIVTRTMTVTDELKDVNHLDDYLLRWAKVTVSDGENSVVLTGKYDDRYFPPFIYTTGRLRGEAGKTYTLEVENGEFLATATTTIPQPTRILSYSQEQYSDSLFQVNISFEDNPQQKNYYQLFCKTGETNKQYLAAFNGTFTDSQMSGMTEVPVYRGHHVKNRAYTPFFVRGENLSVKLATLNETSYSFWDSYVKNQSLSANMLFSTTQNLNSNILGGQGYWVGMGSSVIHLTVGEE